MAKLYRMTVEFSAGSDAKAQQVQQKVYPHLLGAVKKAGGILQNMSTPVTDGAQAPGRLVVYTDGSCTRNPGGPGGWGVRIEHPDGTSSEHYGGEAVTTNNRMEMVALIRALELTPPEASVEIRTDSQYVKKGATEWLAGWAKFKWRTAAGKPVKNKELWEQIAKAMAGRDIKIVWVKGHAGIYGNERADILAVTGTREAVAAQVSGS